MSAAKVDVLAVLDRAYSLASEDAHFRAGNDDVARLDLARAAVAKLIAVAERAKLFVINVPTDHQLDAKLANGDTGREVWGELIAALAAVKGGSQG